MDRIYVTTKKGRRVLRDDSLGGDELRILQYIRDNKSASSSQLEVVGGEGWMVRSLQRRKLIKELTE